MNLFEEYKQLATELNTTKEEFKKIGYGTFFAVFSLESFSEMEKELNGEEITVMEQGTLTINKKAFERMSIKTQNILIKTLKKMLSNKVWGTTTYIKNNKKITGDCLEDFIEMFGKTTWDKICSGVNEQHCIDTLYCSLINNIGKCIHKPVKEDENCIPVNEIMLATKYELEGTIEMEKDFTSIFGVKIW